MTAQMRVLQGATSARETFVAYVAATRPRHWLKNILVFLPIVAAHRLYEPYLLWRALGGFAAFSLCAASIYLFNDLRDVVADRAHPHNRSRPLASGRITESGTLVLTVILLLASLSASYLFGLAFLGVISLYYVTMVIYSLGAKEIPILDVLMLACGYALRVVAGAVATGLAWSAWLSAFCVFLFFSLALIKRYAEMATLHAAGHAEDRVRGYLRQDGVLLVAQGLAAGYLSVLVLALYTNTRMVQAPSGQYGLFWVICLLLLYWISYMWLMAHRGRIQGDPVAFALKDPVSRIIVALAIVVTLLAM
ncbi:MAG TPA: UbiA family prenyltransferase [Steroidobacteraceae bacterium]